MIEAWAIKKILQDFENKDIGSINSLVLQQYICPNALIPGKGVSLLHLIIGHQSESFAFRITKLFLRCGGDPNVPSSDGVTPTHVAAAWGRNRILHLLLVNGGDPWMQDDDKKNAFNYAFEEREWTTIEMLHHFQQMHSAANCKQDLDLAPKYEKNLERVLLRRGDDIFSYTPSKKGTKSMTTQTQPDHSHLSLSPVQDKIRYFEPSPNTEMEVSCQKETDKVEAGWLKDFYQTSCKVVVHQEPPEKPEEKKGTFVSSILINTSPLRSESPHQKPRENTADVNLNVRGQLFAELQEAVRRRSKPKVVQQEGQNPDVSVALLEEDSLEAKEAPYVYGLEESGMPKNMSDFPTKVMNEIEVTEDESSGKTIDLCTSGADVTSTYLSCEEEASRRKSDGRDVRTLQSSSRTSNLYLTPSNSQTLDETAKEEVSNESFASISEEYKYTDVEEGIVLLEKKLVLTPTISLSGDEEATRESSADEDDASTVSNFPPSLSYDSDVLRFELNGLGYNPGPVTKTTKRLYLKKLWKLKKQGKRVQAPQAAAASSPSSFVESSAPERRLTDRKLFEEIPDHRKLEEEMCRSFENWKGRKWREGTNKTSFNYLLLDPRVSRNLPKRASGMTEYDAWTCFVSAIFYVGKGKRSRPYAHLYQATAFWEGRPTAPPDEKSQRILEIWRGGLGVICLQVFQNVIPVEAFTREAAMIDALGLRGLKNAKAGEYYGVASTWRKKDKLGLGVYLLHKAMLIFVNEGERQIKPYDID